MERFGHKPDPLGPTKATISLDIITSPDDYMYLKSPRSEEGDTAENGGSMKTKLDGDTSKPSQSSSVKSTPSASNSSRNPTALNLPRSASERDQDEEEVRTTMMQILGGIRETSSHAPRKPPSLDRSSSSSDSESSPLNQAPSILAAASAYNSKKAEIESDKERGNESSSSDSTSYSSSSLSSTSIPSDLSSLQSSTSSSTSSSDRETKYPMTSDGSSTSSSAPPSPIHQTAFSLASPPSNSLKYSTPVSKSTQSNTKTFSGMSSNSVVQRLQMRQLTQAQAQPPSQGHTITSLFRCSYS